MSSKLRTVVFSSGKARPAPWLGGVLEENVTALWEQSGGTRNPFPRTAQHSLLCTLSWAVHTLSYVLGPPDSRPLYSHSYDFLGESSYHSNIHSAVSSPVPEQHTLHWVRGQQGGHIFLPVSLASNHKPLWNRGDFNRSACPIQAK